MKKSYLYVLMAFAIVPNLSLAQGANIEAEVDQELDQMYVNKQSGTTTAPATTLPPAAVTRTGGQPIYILNQATPTSNANAQNSTTTTQVQKQPVAIIESTPLVESKAEMMRKSRQDAEIQTEQKIVEKLESSRLEDEKRRADALFGNKLGPQVQANQNENTNVIVTAPAPAPTPQVVAQPAPQPTPVIVTPIVVSEPKENVRDVVREELNNAMKVEKEEIETPTETKYFSGMVGIGDYPDVTNVRGNYAVGAAFGTKFDYMIVEGTFMLSNYTVEPTYTRPYSTIEGNQYQAGVGVKYQLMSGLVRPVVGGVAAYSYRKYDWTTVGNYYGYATQSTSDSHAVDLGVTAGVDLEFNKKFALGFEYRYMFNLMSRVPNQAIMTGPQYSNETPLEKLSYYTLGLAAKVNF